MQQSLLHQPSKLFCVFCVFRGNILSSHRIHGIHRIDWQRVSSHRFHRFSQMVCVWSSVNSVCSVGPPTPPSESVKIRAICGRIIFYPPTERTGRDVLPQNSQNSQNRLAEIFSHRFHRFSQMMCVWSSVNSVCSVGPPTPPVNLCKSVQSVGGLFRLRGVYPPTERTGRDVLPQISQILTEQTCRDVLPQNSQNSQNRLAEIFSHRIHGIHRMDW